MTFFEPLPPPPDPGEAQPTGWRPPVWDRPSEATLGAAVPLVDLLATTDRLALALAEVVAYPNGFTFDLVIRANPMAPRAPASPRALEVDAMRRGPRVGFAFADGTLVPDRRSGVPAGAYLAPTPKDDRGIPTVPILHELGGGGSDREHTMHFWCFPLPPAGPMDVYVEWADAGIPETRATLDADAIRAAAEHAVVLWEPEG